MPRGDGTGPMGMGPMTGRRVGYCAGYNAPGYTNPGWAQVYAAPGMTWGGGRGFRRRNWYYATGLPFWARMQPQTAGFEPGMAQAYPPQIDKEREIEILKTQAAQLEDTLKQINERLTRLSE